jgi:CheY-like chemotaxis protein
MTDLILMDNNIPEQYYEHLTDIKQSSVSLLGIINEILDISKIEADKLEIEDIPFSIRDVMAKVVRLLAVKTFQKNIALFCLHEPNLPDQLTGDPTRLRQILLNLLGNAIKFTDEGSITLSVETQQQDAGQISLRFSVTDTGIGIPADKIGGLFESYRQADQSTTRNYGGTGLGLTISKRLVELMGGSIGIDSQPGRGTTFFFTLPFGIAATDLPKPLQTLQASGIPIQAMMIGETDADCLQVMRFLNQWHVEVTLIDSVARYISNGSVNPINSFDLVIFNQPPLSPEVMPRIEMARKELLKNSAAPNVVVLTSDKSIHAMHLIDTLGIRYHLNKPVLQTELANLVHQIFISKPPAPSVHTSPDPLVVPASRQANILVAEDQLINQKIVVQLLTKKGWSVTLAANGTEAVERSTEMSFDLILMDVQMPVMDGFEATRQIRRASRGKNSETPIIALTANAMKGDRERCLDAGMNDYISKPLIPEEFFQTIQKYLTN